MFPLGEVLSAHLLQAETGTWKGTATTWKENAVKELITLLRDDYPTLMSVLGALGEVV